MNLETGTPKRKLASHDEDLAMRYWKNEDVLGLIERRSNFFDELLRETWHHIMPEKALEEISLYAVGGYGRQELLPHSDIDLLILASRPKDFREEIRTFLHSLYDLNVEIGHSVRRLKECRQEAQRDITVATAMFERRLLVGSETLDAKLTRVLNSSRLWPPEAFFKAKRDEQEARHKHFDNVEYGLEPNIKSSPGGLRDLQTAMWVLDRKFGTTNPDALEELGMLTHQEKEWLTDGRRFLLWVRFGLHLLANRKDDRLQFEFQRSLSQRLGFADTGSHLGVERFMHHYYRHVLALREVNDILLQHFDESILRANEKPTIEPINERFRIRNNYIETCSDDVFHDHPSALLEIFVIMANRVDIAGVRSHTIRLIRDSLHVINDEYRRNPENTRLFIDLLKAPHTLVSQLTRMRRYGVLGRYIPEYGEIVGQMQHDLFHIYTVDAHTMMVIRFIRRFHYRSMREHFPVACHCINNIPKIELIYIAGLFHDIGKGRGGDHSQLGADDVTAFCQRHEIGEADTKLVSWLVRQHLLMSSTAQRKDIYDPDVILEFASEVKSEMRLNYLYALTVADINATNPTLWNNWRATLLRQLYGETRKALRRGLESPVDKLTSIRACQESALDKLISQGMSTSEVETIWEIPGDEFFLRHTPRLVAHITRVIQNHDLDKGPLVELQDLKSQVTDEGATEIFLYTRDQANLFAASVVALDQLNLSVFDANIHTSEQGLCLNTYVVLDDSGLPIARNPAARTRVQKQLAKLLAQPDSLQKTVRRLLPRQLKQLTRRTQVRITNSKGVNHTELTIIASDRPGLLARIGLLFLDLGVTVLSARIATLGERVEDVFYILDANGHLIEDKEQAYTLENTLRQRLDSQITLSI
ncbi:MAG: [protein-PII] uridylyltransferase [Gammaproteobacteria bacterium]|nr:[protein-PII] uridylyltransferase [Gammaproteobacteria bacterium]